MGTRFSVLRNGKPAPGAGRAFTLVELLVVVGIIAVLIAILLPALSNARQGAQRVQCLSNLRQMVVAAQIYVGSNQGYYPVAYWSEFAAGTSTSYAWDLTTIKKTGQPTEVVAGLLWQGGDASAIQQCPSFEGKANWAIDPYTGYNYNTSFIGHGQYEATMEPAKASAVKKSAETVLFGDGQWAGGANKFMRAPFPNSGDAGFIGRWAGTQGFRHRNMTNVAYCDGHADSLSERSVDNADGAANVAKMTGFVGRENELYDLE